MSDSPMKQCSKCKKFFPATPDFFDREKIQKSGLRPSCKQCKKDYYQSRKDLIAEQNKLNQEQRTAYMREYRKNDKWKEYNKEYCANYQQTHKEEQDVKKRMWREANRERILQRQRALGKTEQGRLAYRVHKHKRKAQKKAAGGSYTSLQLQEQRTRQKSRCYYCKAKLDKQWHADHVIPLSRGGSNDISNIVITCPTCNMRKNDKLPHEWPEGGRLL